MSIFCVSLCIYIREALEFCGSSPMSNKYFALGSSSFSIAVLCIQSIVTFFSYPLNLTLNYQELRTRMEIGYAHKAHTCQFDR